MTTPAEQTTPPTADATGQAQGDANSGDGEGKQQAAITFASEAEFQKRVDDMLAERLERERKKSEKAAQKAREDAQAEAAAKNGEWQSLAEQRAVKVAELETQLTSLEASKAQADRYGEALSQQVTALRKDVPKHLLPLLDKLDVAEQLEWLASNREQIAPPPVQKPNGVPATPRAQGGMDAAQQEAARQASAAFYRDL
jgi:uncharacterized coiled-coil protein SlyX